MFRVLLLLLAVAGLHARPLHRFPNGRLKPIGPQTAQDEDRDNSVLKDMNPGVKPKKQIPVPVELRRQGTEPSRRFLMDMNNGMLKEEVSEMNRRVSGFYNPQAYGKRQGTEPSRRVLMDMDTGMIKHELGEMNRRVSGFYNPPAYEMRKGTQNSQATLVDPRTGQKLPSPSELKRRTAPLDEFRQGTEHQLHILQDHHMMKPHEQREIPADPSRNVLMDLNTGLLKEHRNELDGRVSGSAKWEVVSGPEHEDIKSQDSSERKENHIAVPVELRRQGTEPSRRFLMDMNNGMLKEEVSEMNRRVSGFYNPQAYGKRQGTEPSRRVLMDMDTGMIKHELGEMNRRVSGFYNPPAYEMRKGTQNSQATLVDPRTGQKLPSPSELKRRTAPLDEFRQGTEHQLHILQDHHMMKPHEQREIPADPSRNVLMDLNTGLLKEHRNELDGRVSGSAKWEVVSGPEHEDIRSQDSSERKENHIAVPVELRRQGTEPSRRFLMDMNNGMLKEEVSEMNRRVSGFYNPQAYGKRQGTEPSRRVLMDMDTGMIKHELGEMNRRVSGFYNPPAYEMRKGTQNSQATLVDPRTGQKLPSPSELKRRTAPSVDEFRQGIVFQPHILHELRLTEMHKQGSEPSRNLKMDLNTGLPKEHQHKMHRRSTLAEWEVVSGPEHEDIRSQDSSERKENHIAVPVELRRQGTEPSRRFLMDMNNGMLKEEVSEMNRRVSGFYNPQAYGKRQGTEPSRRVLMDMDTGMIKHELGEMNRRVSGFYNPPAYEMRKGTQNSQATLVDPRTGQKLPSPSELKRRTAPLDEFGQGPEHQLHILQKLRNHHIIKPKYNALESLTRV